MLSPTYSQDNPEKLLVCVLVFCPPTDATLEKSGIRMGSLGGYLVDPAAGLLLGIARMPN